MLFRSRCFWQSQGDRTIKFTEVSQLAGGELVGTEVTIRARLASVRSKGKLAFVTLRAGLDTVQLTVSADVVPREMVGWVAKVPKESIVEVIGQVVTVETPLTGYSIKDVEVHVKKLYVISKAMAMLPIQVEDCERPQSVIDERNAAVEGLLVQIKENTAALAAGDLTEEGKKELEAKGKQLKSQLDRTPRYVEVSQPERLDNRVIDLRTTTNQAIFRISSLVGHLFRSYCFERGMVEIHTPKILGAASEGGANVFKLQYFDRPAFLAQSPQLYKQMCVAADFPGVYEVGPVFRAENSNTLRHLTEFTGLDVEMPIKEHYHEVLEFFGGLFRAIFSGIPKHCARELEAIRQQFPFEDFLYFEEKPLILRFEEGINLLHQHGHGLHLTIEDDLDTESEKILGNLIRQQYHTDFYMLDKFPLKVRPFYTMPDPYDGRWSNSYDFFMRGQEIVSGAQRIHDPELLTQRAKEHNIPIDTIKPYIDSFKYGAPPHAGGGIGLERVVFLYLGLTNIRRTSIFPRDPQRITP